MKKILAIIFSMLIGWGLGWLIYFFLIPVNPKEDKEERKVKKEEKTEINNQVKSYQNHQMENENTYEHKQIQINKKIIV